MRLIIALKWETYGRRIFLTYNVPYFLLLTSFWFGFLYDVPTLRWASYVLSVFNLLFEELRELIFEGVYEYFGSIWNYFSFPAYLGILYAGTYRDILPAFSISSTYFYDPTASALVLSFAAFCLLLRSLEFLSILGSTSLFVVTVRLLILDIVMWSTLFVLFIFTFATAFKLLLDGEENFTSFPESVVTVFRMSIGDFDYPFTEDEAKDGAATILWVSYTFLVHLLYLNVLIAMMSKSFETVESKASGMARWGAARSEGRGAKQRCYMNSSFATRFARRCRFLVAVASSSLTSVLTL